MKNTLIIGALVMAGTIASSSQAREQFAEIALAVANPDRLAEDRERDAGRMPSDALSFFGVKPGMVVIEYGSGGGYFTELLSRVVGIKGRVIAQNPFIFLKLNDGELAKRYGDARLQNVVVVFGNPSVLALPDDSVDAAFFIDTYHDIAYSKDAGEGQPPLAAAALKEARRVLKPGALFGVIDHRANSAASRSESAKLHRIVESRLRSDFEAAGFRFDGASDVYHNAKDDRSKAWFQDPSLQDHTDRLMHRYRSPD